MSLLDFLNQGNYPSSWKGFFESEEVQAELQDISNKLSTESPERIYPMIHQVFRAFYATPLNKVKVVLIGQDPYRNGSAVGLCFSVKPGNAINPSLRNIYKELKNEGISVQETGNITHWARQGVFMLNTALTVEKGNADSHAEIWVNFTHMALQYLAEHTKKTVWLLWGGHAHSYRGLLQKTSHIPVLATHPSPFSATRASSTAPAFIGSNVFTETNSQLLAMGKDPVEW